jgi:exopolyphosphatase / guanosine-5'-triphosphate,3'-diphosphate pyrophosphatase
MFACIDLGSNSFHLLIAHWKNGGHEIVERFSEKVQLGEGIARSGQITPAAFARGVACLDTFSAALRRYPVTHLWVVGTNALRVASNAQAFLSEAEARGLSVDVVSGLEEATLIYAGVMSALPDDGNNRLVVDIGGGSTELIVGQGTRQLQAHSMPIGCVSWRDQWFAESFNDAASVKQRLDEAATAAEELFKTVADQLARTPWIEVYASSGTAKMLSALCTERTAPGSAPLGVEMDVLKSLESDIIQISLSPQLSLRGLKNSRRELVLPGWAVLLGFMRANNIQALNFSHSALREGMLHFLVEAARLNESPLHVLRAR